MSIRFGNEIYGAAAIITIAPLFASVFGMSTLAQIGGAALIQKYGDPHQNKVSAVASLLFSNPVKASNESWKSWAGRCSSRAALQFVQLLNGMTLVKNFKGIESSVSEEARSAATIGVIYGIAVAYTLSVFQYVNYDRH